MMKGSCPVIAQCVQSTHLTRSDFVLILKLRPTKKEEKNTHLFKKEKQNKTLLKIKLLVSALQGGFSHAQETPTTR